MTLNSLQALTWGTIGGAVASALLLAAGASGVPAWSHGRHTRTADAVLPASAKGTQPDALATAQPLAETQRQIGVR